MASLGATTRQSTCGPSYQVEALHPPRSSCHPQEMGTRTDGTTTRTLASTEDWRRMSGHLPEPPRKEDRDDLLWQELTVQFGWYDKAATRSRLSYQVLKLTALAAGAAVTVLAALSAPAALTASLAGVIVVLEGAQQMFQFHPNWISYRGTAETLRHHAFLYVADVSPFDDPATRRDRLGVSLRDATMRESATWTDTMRKSGSGPGSERT
jgi:hypothetical protein